MSVASAWAIAWVLVIVLGVLLSAGYFVYAVRERDRVLALMAALAVYMFGVTAMLEAWTWSGANHSVVLTLAALLALPFVVLIGLGFLVGRLHLEPHVVKLLKQKERSGDAGEPMRGSEPIDSGLESSGAIEGVRPDRFGWQEGDAVYSVDKAGGPIEESVEEFLERVRARAAARRDGEASAPSEQSHGEEG